MSPKILKLIENINDVIISPIITFLFIIAVTVFLWGVVEFIWKAGSEVERKKGQEHMLWGVVGLFIMVSVVAIINIFLSTFGINTI